MSKPQPTAEEDEAVRLAFRDLGLVNRVRITTEDDGPKWNPGDEDKLLKRAPLPKGTDAMTVKGTNAWNTFHLKADAAVDGEAKQLETIAGGFCSGQTHRLNRMRQGNFQNPAPTYNPPNPAPPNRVPATGQLRDTVQFRNFGRAPHAGHPTQRGVRASGKASLPSVSNPGPVTGDDGNRPGHGKVTNQSQASSGPQKSLPKPPHRSFAHHPIPNVPPPKTLSEDPKLFMKKAAEGLASSRWASSDIASKEKAAPQIKATAQVPEDPQDLIIPSVKATAQVAQPRQDTIISSVGATPKARRTEDPATPRTTAAPLDFASSTTPRVKLPSQATAIAQTENARPNPSEHAAIATASENVGDPQRSGNSTATRNPALTQAVAWGLSFSTLHRRLDNLHMSIQNRYQQSSIQSSATPNPTPNRVSQGVPSTPQPNSSTPNLPTANPLRVIVSGTEESIAQVDASNSQSAQNSINLIDFSDDEAELPQRLGEPSPKSEVKVGNAAPPSDAVAVGQPLAQRSSKWSTSQGNLIPGQMPSSALEMLELATDFEDFPTLAPNRSQPERHSPVMASQASSEALPPANRDFPLSKFSSFSTAPGSGNKAAEPPVLNLASSSGASNRPNQTNSRGLAHDNSQALLRDSAIATESPITFTTSEAPRTVSHPIVPAMPQTPLQTAAGPGGGFFSTFHRVVAAISSDTLVRAIRSPESNVASSVPESSLREQSSALAPPSMSAELQGTQQASSTAQQDKPSPAVRIGTPIADEFMATKVSIESSSFLPPKQVNRSMASLGPVPDEAAGPVPRDHSQNNYNPPSYPVMPPTPAFGVASDSIINLSNSKHAVKKEDQSLASSRYAPVIPSPAGEGFGKKIPSASKEGKENVTSITSIAGIRPVPSAAPAPVKRGQGLQPIQTAQSPQHVLPAWKLQATQPRQEAESEKPLESTESDLGLAASRWAPPNLPTQATKRSGSSRRR